MQNDTFLITGGTGSFGEAAVRRLLGVGCREIRVFSRDELKQHDMRLRYSDERLRFFIGDVRNLDSLRAAARGVDLIFHAAALKQVPSCEFFPLEAVHTNVLGTHNVLRAAQEAGCRRVVCLSTDKAAYPINAMGMTKALGEKITQAAARFRQSDAEPVAAVVRYGNVLCSRGSVVPLFLDQILRGGPLTITNPRMTRFLLPLETALDLVLFALDHARPGELFLRKAPACTVEVLATALCEAFERNVERRIIGMRHGEKLFETLATRDEMSRAEDLGDYLRIRLDDRDLSYQKYFTEGNVDELDLEDYTSHNTRRLDVEEVKEVLCDLPEIRAALRAGGGNLA